jgi:hypothetical protein
MSSPVVRMRVMWYALDTEAQPSTSTSGVAPRASAAGTCSSTTAAAPSPSTKPSRCVENGQEARCGSTSRSDSAPIFWNAASTIGHMVASADTTSTRSARPLVTAS